MRAESKRHQQEGLTYLFTPKLLIVDELGYLPCERRAAHLLFQPLIPAIQYTLAISHSKNGGTR